MATDRDHLMARIDATEGPMVVAVPLIARGWDALEIAIDLSRMKRQDMRLRVLTPVLPNPKMILSELRRKAPGISIDLLDPTREPRPRRLV